jgi:hypothetical protein
LWVAFGRPIGGSGMPGVLAMGAIQASEGELPDGVAF